MGLVGTVKNIFVRVWAWLERFVEEEAAYQAKIAAEKIAAKKISGAKKKAKAVIKEKEEVNLYPWTLDKNKEWANKYNFTINELLEDTGDRIYAEWTRN